jgi:hypothetical protein
MDWRILGAALGGGLAGIATVLVIMSQVQPDSMQSFVIVGAIVLIAILAIQFIRLRRQGPRS